MYSVYVVVQFSTYGGFETRVCNVTHILKEQSKALGPMQLTSHFLVSVSTLNKSEF